VLPDLRPPVARVYEDSDHLRELESPVRQTQVYSLGQLRHRDPIDRRRRSPQQIFIFEQIALFFLLFAFSKYFYSGFVSLDFFDTDFLVGYKVVNLTYLEMFENSAMLLCFYVLR
jgi:hypothetical protein